MNLPISTRLLACAKMVRQGARVADVGCDHGYLSIYLLKQKIATSVIASDIRSGPLESARKNANKYGVTEDITFCLSAGVERLNRDFDTLVCAGMGGITMISILENAPWLKNGAYTLILQCQSKTHLLRRYLLENGWMISKETVIRDGRFLYTVMEVTWQPGEREFRAGDAYFPSVLLENSREETSGYYRQVLKKLRVRVAGHAANADPWEVQALADLETLAQQPEFSYLKEEIR